MEYLDRENTIKDLYKDVISFLKIRINKEDIQLLIDRFAYGKRTKTLAERLGLTKQALTGKNGRIKRILDYAREVLNDDKSLYSRYCSVQSYSQN